VSGLAVPAAAGETGRAGEHAPHAAACDRFAARDGSDSAPGTFRRPFRSAPRLAAALRPGQTGCFRRGTYRFSDLRIETRRSTLRPFEGERVTLRGDMRIAPEARGATIAGMRLNGTNDQAEIR
jgi:hypothetical protein